MRLHKDWKTIALHAWGQRLTYATILLAGADAAMSYAVDGRIGASLAVFAVSVSSAGARLVKQESVSGKDKGDDE